MYAPNNLNTYNIYSDEGVPNIEPTAPPLDNNNLQNYPSAPQHITNNITNNIINHRIPISTEIIYQNMPVRCICRYCNSIQITVIKEKYSILQHLLAVICCCYISPCCCCCLPYCANFPYKIYIHKCRNCHKYLGLYK